MPTEMKETVIGAAKTEEAAELDPKALDAIRSLMETENEPARTDATEATVRQPQVATAANNSPAHSVPKHAAQAADTTAPAARKPGPLARAKSRAFGYRPTPKQLFLASITLLVLFRPWLVVGFILATIFTFVFVLLVLGYDGFWQRSMAIGRWYARRRPSRAAEIHRKLDDFALKWDAVLDRFPEGTVDALYLPDFGDMAVAEKRHEEAMDRRLATLREGEV